MPYIYPSAPVRMTKASPVLLWRALHTVADAAYPRLLRLWLTQLHDAQAAVDESAVAQLLTVGDIAGAERFVATAWMTAGLGPLPDLLEPILQQTLVRGASATVRAWPQLTGVVFQGRFNLQAPEAVAWLRRFGAEQVAQIDETTRAGLRTALTSGLEAQQPPAQTARQLRSQLGLTSQQQSAVAMAEVQWRAEGKTEAQVTGLRERLAAQKLRQRAEVIAHTESMTAANMGNQQLTIQARDAGWLSVTAKRTWVITPDSHLCPGCAKIPEDYPDGVGLQETFLTQWGAVLTPPAHPTCRCAVSIEV